MKIVLEEPFASKWRYGYLVTNKEQRKHVVLFNTNKDRSTISYARYLYSVKIRTFLSDDVHIDHIDNDKTNDSLDNLQALTPKENAAKAGLVKRKMRHGTLSAYRYCKCETCSIGKRLYNKNPDEYWAFINSLP